MTNSDLRSRLPVIGFLTGAGLSLLGNAMALVALPWFVLLTTGSASQTGFTAVAGSLPAMISGLLGGPLVDKLGGKRMSIVADVVSAISILLIPIFYHADMLTFPLLLVLVFFGALLDIPGITGRRMLLPTFQRKAGIRSEQMNSAFEVLSNAAFMVGPILAGILIGVIGPVNLLWITAGGFAISAFAVLFAAEDVEITIPDAQQSYLESMREGLQFIVRTPLLLALALLLAGSNFVSNSFFAVGLPVFVHDHWGSASRLGLLFSSLGVGTLLGAGFYGAFGHRLRSRRHEIILFGFVSQPIWFAAFIWTGSLPILMAATFMMGFAAGPANPLTVGVRFEHIPKALQGRVFATFSAITATITPIGIAIGGWVFERYDVRTGMTVIVIAYVVYALILPFIRPLREMNTPGPFAEDTR